MPKSAKSVSPPSTAKHWPPPPPEWWSKSKPLRWLPIVIVLIGIAASWEFAIKQRPVVEHPLTGVYRAIEEPRVELASAFRSYDAAETIRAQLEGAGLSVATTRIARAPSERYPPREMLTLKVSDYRHLGVSGELALDFFNNRLMEANFRPADPLAYAPRLHAALPQLKRDRIGKSELVNGSLRVWSNVDLAKSRVGDSLDTVALTIWQDSRLIVQRDAWDRDYGHIPPPAKR